MTNVKTESVNEIIAEYKGFCKSSKYDGRYANIMLDKEQGKLWVDYFVSRDSRNVYKNENIKDVTAYAQCVLGEITTDTIILAIEQLSNN